MTATAHSSTVDVAGATIAYDVRGPLDGVVPLVLIGSPMSAEGFGTLAGHFPDRTLITLDPRNSGRSSMADPAAEVSPAEHASDVLAVLDALGVERADLFASSGGAVNALELVALRPGILRTLVAHEPPAVAMLPDREAATAVTDDLWATYQARGFNAAMAKFIAVASHQGEFTGPVPDVDPAQFGMPDTDDGNRTDPLFYSSARGCYAWEPDVAALQAAPTRIVVAAGEETGDELTARAARAVAEALDLPLTMFPSHHSGFLGGEFGQTGDPDAFGPRLREVLEG